MTVLCAKPRPAPLADELKSVHSSLGLSQNTRRLPGSSLTSSAIYSIPPGECSSTYSQIQSSLAEDHAHISLRLNFDPSTHRLLEADFAEFRKHASLELSLDDAMIQFLGRQVFSAKAECLAKKAAPQLLFV